MKNLLLGAASVLAIGVAFAANAQPQNPAAPAAPMSKPIAPVSKPASPAPAPLLAPGTPPAKVMAPAPAMPLQKPMMPMAQPSKMNPAQPCHAQPPKHHAHKKQHHKHHPHHKAPVAPRAEGHVTFPPAQGCNLEYYCCGASNYPYVYHGGYFWYPQSEATALAGYTPSYWNGSYWYASRMHPHMLYVEGQGATYVVPLNMTSR